jgi:hypothetical protein
VIIPPCASLSTSGKRLNGGLAYFFAFLTVFRGAAARFTTGLALGASGLGALPITDLTGHTLKIGHFGQPTAMAMGQRAMVNFE